MEMGVMPPFGVRGFFFPELTKAAEDCRRELAELPRRGDLLADLLASSFGLLLCFGDLCGYSIGLMLVLGLLWAGAYKRCEI